MAKTYVTFGQDHAHSVGDRTFDKDSVAVINCKDGKEGRELAFTYFDRKFCFEYHEDEFDQSKMHFYPRGLIEVNPM